MILILEIILTIIAWQRGWKWKALIPVTAAFIMGIFLATISIATGNIPNPSSTVMWDIMAVIALIILCSIKPKEIKKEM
jgi:hypothetical protein